MVKKILLLAIVAFFVAGTLSAMAGEQEKCPIQCTYDWISSWGKPCGEKSASTCTCKTCGAQCCSSCNSDCGGKCCSSCKSK